ncbi:MAG TPA: copper-binding protein [Paralcaligenes sp.]
MKITSTLSLMIALSASTLAFAQSGNMKNMNASAPAQSQNMDMKAMGMQQGNMMDMSKMDKMGQTTAPKTETHAAVGVVKATDLAKSTVTVAHGPVASLKWPAMAMTFAVKDKTLFDKLAVGNKVSIEFLQQGSDYVVTSVK